MLCPPCLQLRPSPARCLSPQMDSLSTHGEQTVEELQQELMSLASTLIAPRYWIARVEPWLPLRETPSFQAKILAPVKPGERVEFEPLLSGMPSFSDFIGYEGGYLKAWKISEQGDRTRCGFLCPRSAEYGFNTSICKISDTLTLIDLSEHSDWSMHLECSVQAECSSIEVHPHLVFGHPIWSMVLAEKPIPQIS